MTSAPRERPAIAYMWASKDSAEVEEFERYSDDRHNVPLNVAQAAVIRVQAVLRSACDAAVEMRICGDRPKKPIPAQSIHDAMSIARR